MVVVLLHQLLVVMEVPLLHQPLVDMEELPLLQLPRVDPPVDMAVEAKEDMEVVLLPEVKDHLVDMEVVHPLVDMEVANNPEERDHPVDMVEVKVRDHLDHQDMVVNKLNKKKSLTEVVNPQVVMEELPLVELVDMEANPLVDTVDKPNKRKNHTEVVSNKSKDMVANNKSRDMDSNKSLDMVANNKNKVTEDHLVEVPEDTEAVLAKVDTEVANKLEERDHLVVMEVVPAKVDMEVANSLVVKDHPVDTEVDNQLEDMVVNNPEERDHLEVMVVEAKAVMAVANNLEEKDHPVVMEATSNKRKKDTEVVNNNSNKNHTEANLKVDMEEPLPLHQPPEDMVVTLEPVVTEVVPEVLVDTLTMRQLFL